MVGKHEHDGPDVTRERAKGVPSPAPATVRQAFDLTGRVAVITGGAGLLGSKHGEAIIELGGIPVLLDLNGERARAGAETLATRFGGKAVGLGCDITRLEAVEEALDQIRSTAGRVDILVNNAANNPKVEGGAGGHFSHHWRLSRSRCGAWISRLLPLWRLTAQDCDRLCARMADQGLGPSGPLRPCGPPPRRCPGGAVGMVDPEPGIGSDETARPEDDHRATHRRRRAQAPRRGLACRRGTVVLAPGRRGHRARRGEICALRWCDIDLDDRVARIDRSVTATDADGIIITCTKTDRPRVASLTRQAVAALSSRRIEAISTARAAGFGLADLALIFSVDPGDLRPWQPDAVTARWGRLRASAGLLRIRIHDLLTSSPPSSCPRGSISVPWPTASVTPAPRPPSTSTGAGYRPVTARRPTTSIPCSRPMPR